MKFSFADLFFDSCKKYSNNPAIVTKDKQLSYKELFLEVSNVYHFLLEAEVQESIIGIYAKTDLENAIGLLAISALGSAYLPLNPESPIERNQYIVANCGVNCILVFEDVSSFGDKTLKVEAHQYKLDADYNLKRVVEQDLAYVLYTSGSTGVPKGVPIYKENVEALFAFFLTTYDFNEQDRFTQTSNWTFDISVWSFFLPLMFGASISFVPKEGLKFVQILAILQKQEITVAFLVPSIVALSKKYLHEIHLPILRYCFFAGEVLLHDLVELWQESCPNCQIENHYGLTETTVVNTRYIWSKNHSEKEIMNGIIPIGYIYPNTQMLIFNKEKQVCDIGEIGELYLSGKQIVQHYVNNEFSECVCEIEFKGETKVFFKTGDLVKMNDSGCMLYVGRNDEQVQLQGHRVELKEIEYHLQKITGNLCAVIAKEDVSGNLFLVAFIEQLAYTKNQILVKLSKKVAPYMIPKKIVFLDEMPLNQNGKIDKTRLKNQIK